MIEKSTRLRLEEIKEEISTKSMMIQPFLIVKEAANLPYILEPDEKIISAIASSREKDYGLLLATDRRIIFTNTTAFNQFENGIPYHEVAEIKCFPHTVPHHSLMIIVSGKGIVFDTNGMLYAQAFCEKVSNFLSQWKQEHIAEENDSNPDQDIFEQLEKLGDLWQKGILTNEEFAAQKQRLLAKL